MSIRDIGIVAWRDPQASLESMRGPRWQRTIRAEARHYQTYIENPAIQLRIPAYRLALDKYKTKTINKLYAPGIQISIISRGNAGIQWAIHPSEKYHDASDIDVSPDGRFIVTCEDVGGGAHFNNLSARDSKGRTKWTKRDVGSSVACVGDRVYFLRPKKKLWYHECWSCDLATGAQERMEFAEKNPMYNLGLVKEANRQLYLYGDNNGYSHLHILQADGTFVPLDQDAIYHIPADAANRIVMTNRGTWELRSPIGTRTLCREPYFYNAATELALYRVGGNVIGQVRGRKIFEYVGAHVDPDTYKLWSTGALTLIVDTPTHMQMTLHMSRGGMIQRQVRHASRPHVRWHQGNATSADGTSVPYGYATISQKPKALLVYMYGAYGLPTTPGNVLERWGPLLEAGWAIGYAFVRGGGDNGWAWAETARRTGRGRTIEDAEACITALRRRLDVSAARTAIYGRSAGGILMGTLTNRHPGGDLFGVVYAEVPYVDVLQTATNPDLPLTVLEYDEFGDPAHRIEDLTFWAKYSPTMNVPAGGVPDLKVLCRTGANDTQVYAYEPLKWIRLLRGGGGGGQEKILAIALGQGHFYTEMAELEAQAIDMAILDHWITTN